VVGCWLNYIKADCDYRPCEKRTGKRTTKTTRGLVATKLSYESRETRRARLSDRDIFSRLTLTELSPESPPTTVALLPGVGLDRDRRLRGRGEPMRQQDILNSETLPAFSVSRSSPDRPRPLMSLRPVGISATSFTQSRFWMYNAFCSVHNNNPSVCVRSGES
jgi:hypothetical protein